MVFKLFMIDITGLYLYYDICPLKSFLIPYFISFYILSLYYFYCIFIESEFDSRLIQLYQIRFEKYRLLASFIGFFSLIILLLYFSFMPYYYMIYKSECPFCIKNVDYKIHAKRRCELYNINTNPNIIYQYICTFNAEKMRRLPSKIFNINIQSKNCNKVEKLIENNEVIQAFVNEYYAEPDLYYCDLQGQPSIGVEVNPKDCDAKIFISPELLLVLHYYYSLRYAILFYTYFRNIEVNINHFRHVQIL